MDKPSTENPVLVELDIPQCVWAPLNSPDFDRAISDPYVTDAFMVLTQLCREAPESLRDLRWPYCTTYVDVCDELREMLELHYTTRAARVVAELSDIVQTAVLVALWPMPEDGNSSRAFTRPFGACAAAFSASFVKDFLLWQLVGETGISIGKIAANAIEKACAQASRSIAGRAHSWYTHICQAGSIPQDDAGIYLRLEMLRMSVCLQTTSKSGTD